MSDHEGQRTVTHMCGMGLKGDMEMRSTECGNTDGEALPSSELCASES